MAGKRLVLVGCGKMGSAMLAGWLTSQDLEEAWIVEPNARAISPAIRDDTRVHVFDGLQACPKARDRDAVVLAVKPQTMDDALHDIGRVIGDGTVTVSIAAGKTLQYFARHLGVDAAVVRAMPNTPAAVSQGQTVCVANGSVTPGQRTLADSLLRAVGAVDWVEDEALIDVVTAVSGGGPAYVFLLMEVLAEAGVRAGLPTDLAMRIARQTIIGSGLLAQGVPDIPAATLRQNVTSPGGTTAEALRVLMADAGLQPLFDKAIAAATERSRELAG